MLSLYVFGQSKHGKAGEFHTYKGLMMAVVIPEDITSEPANLIPSTIPLIPGLMCQPMKKPMGSFQKFRWLTGQGF